tara:strand:+ start:51 stop:1220 length:1170 start_codon:yes stop_codon:yes gene_type:complete
MSLQGKSQIDRMHELMNSMTNGTVIKNPVVPKQKNAVDGKTYGIVKENSYYIIKEHNGRNYGYINGLKNKTDFKYNSYAEAMKQMNLMFGSLNEAYGYEEGVDLFTEGKKKYVIRTGNRQQEQEENEFVDPNPEVGTGSVPTGPPAPTAPVDNSRKKAVGPTTPPKAPTPMPSGGVTPDRPTPGRPTPAPAVPSPAPSGGGIDFDSEVSSIERDLGGGEESPEKEIQSLTGKLGQALRQGEAEQVVDTELTKYVVNSVFSALNIGELTDEDKLEIIKKVKNAGTDDEMSGTPDMPDMGGRTSNAQIGMPGGHPEEEDDTEMEIDGLDSGMENQELDLDIDDFEDDMEGMEEDMLYGDGEESDGGITDLSQSLRDFVVKTVDSYIETRPS